MMTVRNQLFLPIESFSNRKFVGDKCFRDFNFNSKAKDYLFTVSYNDFSNQTISTLWQYFLAAVKNDSPLYIIDESFKSPLPPLFLDQLGGGIILRTSGSSDTPKFIFLSANALIKSASSQNCFIESQLGNLDGRQWSLNLPLFHVSGFMILLRAWLAGQKVDRSLSSGGLLSLVPTQLDKMLDENKNLEDLGLIFIGGSRLSHRTKMRCLEKKIPISLCYGSTETCAMVTATNLNPIDEENNIGSPLLDRDITIENNCLIIKGKTIDGSNWEGHKWQDFYQVKMPDFASFNHKNQLILGERKDQIFTSGGENINPQLIENSFMEINGVENVFCAPLESKRWGQVAACFVQGEKIKSAKFYEQTLEEKLPLGHRPRFIFPMPKQTGIKSNNGEMRTLLKSDRNILLMHGFMGNKNDWNFLTSTSILKSRGFNPLPIDLPGHGEREFCSKVEFFEYLDSLFEQNLIFGGVGYSMGGRILLEYFCTRQFFHLPLFLEGVHPGISQKTEQLQRLKQDQCLFENIVDNTYPQFLESWYKMPLFSTLNQHPQFQSQILKPKLGNKVKEIQKAMIEFSPGQQLHCRPLMREFSHIHFLSGKEDQKYHQLGEQLNNELPNFEHLALEAGHNTHFQNPECYFKHLATYLDLIAAHF